MIKENTGDGEIHEEVAAPPNKLPESEELPDKTKDQKDSNRSNEQEESNTVPFYRLFSFADTTDCLLMFVGTVSAAANGICMPLLTVLFGRLVNAFGGDTDIRKLSHKVSQVSLAFLYLGLVSSVVAFLRKYLWFLSIKNSTSDEKDGTEFIQDILIWAEVSCWVITGERQAARIRTLYLKAILRQNIGFFDKETHAGEIVERMSGDTILIQDAMGEKVGKFIQLAATFIGGFIVAFVEGWLLALVMLSSVPPTVVSGAMMTILVVKLASRGQAAYSSAAEVVEQTVGSIRTVASFTGEKLAVVKYENCLAKAYKAGVQQGVISGLGFGTVMFIMCCTYALAIWFGGKLILEKGYSGGHVINILFAVLTGSLSLGQASPCLSAFASGQAAAFKMFKTIERKPDIDAYDLDGRKLDNFLGSIEFKDVHFSYPARPDEQIFHGLSLSIQSGTTAALVGESGSGKSTVISLIERFYDPQAGEVLIDGINIKEFQLKWIRQKIGLVSQEPVLFNSSIRDNIAYGKDGATDGEIKAAAVLANAAKFIDKLPQGLDTMVGEQGTQLSGGQKQRVAIARAILKDPRILLLDEATSALDAESEKAVQEALDRMMLNRTTVIVAHRLSTVRNADMIAVIHRGKIVEKGKHSDLIKDESGAYSQLVRLQLIRMMPESNVLNDPEKSEPTMDSGKYPTQRISFLRSISHSSSENGNSSRHSFSLPFGVPTGATVLQTEPTEYYPSAPEISTRHPDVPLHRVAYLHKPEVPVLVLGVFAAAGAGSVSPVMGILLSGSIKSFFEPAHELRKDTRFWAWIYVALGVASLLTLTMRQYFFSVAGCKLINRIRLLCFDRVVHMEVGWFDEADHSSGEIGGRLSADTAAVRGLVGDALGVLVQNMATAVVGLAISFATNWQLSLVVLALVPFIGVNGYFQMRFLRGFVANAKKIYEEASQIAKDAVGSIRTVASFCAEEKVMQLYKKKCQGPMKSAIKQGIISGIGYGIGFFFLFSVHGASFYAGARLVEAGETTFPQVFRVFFCLAMTAIGISQSGNLAPEAEKAKSAVASVFAILDRRSGIDSSDESGTTLENLSGEIEFRHVCFEYPTRPNVPVFQDLCLLIPPGKTVALVGESGSGKSTVISLLQRFYDPYSGQILLDGNEIQKLQLKWLRQQMGLVSQEPVLFNDTVRANIASGKEGNATESEITAAAELANAHCFISSLQQGYETLVGERGVQLSGGQKQRVAIARAIVKAPNILLLDEATSALDAEAESVVQDALDRVMLDRTTIVVAHRLPTITGADLIAVVKNGGIAEKGDHETLMNIKDGIYASLVALNTSATAQ